MWPDKVYVNTVFQSTHPVRGATAAHVGIVLDGGISIHAPREGCDKEESTMKKEVKISIHAPREGCDYTVRARDVLDKEISIHAPREGCDNGVYCY